MNKEKPLATELLKHLEACEEYYMENTQEKHDDVKKYELDLKYLTTLSLISIFSRLDRIAAIMTANREDGI
jgi:hypothetical protein